MENLHQFKRIRNRSAFAAIAVTISLLTMSLTFPFQSWASAVMLNPKFLRNIKRLGIGAKTIDRRSLSGESLARLEIVPSDSADDAQFTVEGLQPYTGAKVTATGKVRLSETSLSIQIEEVKSGTRVGMKLTIDPTMPGRFRNVLSINNTRYKFTIDVGRAKTLGKDAQALLADGKGREASRLISQLSQTLSSGDDYFAFTKLVNSSPAFEAINIVASLIATATTDEISRNPALLAISSAVKIFVPAACKTPSPRADSPQQARFIQASYTRNSRNYMPTAQSGVCCSACDAIALAAIGGCIFAGIECEMNNPGGIPDLLCDILTAACVGGGIYLAYWCQNNCIPC